MSKIVSIQILRGVAATLVAGYHLQQAALAEGKNPGLFQVFAGGEIGVDIFFVLSGFIIFFVASSRPNLTRGAFISARFWRIFPPYWSILTLYVLAALALALVLGDQSKLPDAQSLLVSYLLLPFPDHVIIIAWTLSLELLFYAVFALTFFSAGGAKRLIIVMIVWVLISQIFLHFNAPRNPWLAIPFHSAVLEFLFGTLIAIKFLESQATIRRFRVPVLVLGAVGVSIYLVSGGFHIGPFGREIAAGVPSALLVFGALGFTASNMKMLETWGESSYILYLFHVLYFMIVGKIVEIVLGQNVYSSQVWMLSLLASVVAISYAATIWIERPYQAWYRRFVERKKPY
ncbi:acyltransferase family protein [Sulfitobacter sp.]|uniref:acyltransferase family protein n=1 Tax=Sulfitobacter sp. TaxID=1903071 RepID=UPI0030017D65